MDFVSVSLVRHCVLIVRLNGVIFIFVFNEELIRVLNRCS